MYEVEHTDTFGGEANYCWVRRYQIPDGTRAALVRRAKALTGLTGHRCKVYDQGGDLIEIRPQGLCQVVFVSWVEDNLGGSRP